MDGSSIFPQPTKDDKYVVRAGAALEAYCRPRNHENVNPSAVVTWVNGNKEQISDSPFLFISQIQTNQAGQYFCRAENGFGQSEYAISVVVTGTLHRNSELAFFLTVSTILNSNLIMDN